MLLWISITSARPEKLEHLIPVWFDEAEKNMVLPLDDRDATQQANVVRPTEEAPRDEYTYYPGAAPVPESVAVNIRGCSYKIRAEVNIQDGCEGVIFAHGSRFGGHSLFIQDMKLYYVYNFLGIRSNSEFPPEPNPTPPRTREVHLRRGVHEEVRGNGRENRGTASR